MDPFVGATLVSSTGNFLSQLLTNRHNRKMVEATNKQNLELQYEQWKREDNAVQRRAEDLKAAGINPLLAAGQAATSSQPMGMNAPRAEAPHISLDMVERAMRMKDDFATSETQRQLNKTIAWEHEERARNLAQEREQKAEIHPLSMKQLSANMEHVIADTERIGLESVLLRQRENLNEIGYSQAKLDLIHDFVMNGLREDLMRADVDNRKLEVLINDALLQITNHDRDIVLGNPAVHSHAYGNRDINIGNLIKDVVLSLIGRSPEERENNRERAKANWDNYWNGVLYDNIPWDEHFPWLRWLRR